jgi:hypothetical protein
MRLLALSSEPKFKIIYLFSSSEYMRIKKLDLFGFGIHRATHAKKGMFHDEITTLATDARVSYLGVLLTRSYFRPPRGDVEAGSEVCLLNHEAVEDLWILVDYVIKKTE